MLNVVVHANKAIPWHKRWSDFFENGLKKHKINVTISSQHRYLPDCDVAILFGPNLWKGVEASGKPRIMVNRKFFGKEEHVAGDIVSLSWTGFNGLGFHCVEKVSSDRLYKFLDPNQIKPWKPTGTEFLLCGQADLARCMKYKNLEMWYKEVREMINAPVKFRPHPTKGKPKPLLEDLENVKAAIVLNSTVSLDILLEGVPVITMDVGDATYGITGHTIDDIRYPDRLPLIEYLAHCQWHYTEIQDGTFWNQLYPKRGNRLYEFNHS